LFEVALLADDEEKEEDEEEDAEELLPEKLLPELLSILCIASNPAFLAKGSLVLAPHELAVNMLVFSP